MAFLTHMFPLSSHHLKEVKSTSTEMTVAKVTEHLILENYDKIVIAGPDRADKTSLVFQAAVSNAVAGAKVTYICTHPLKCLPKPVHGMVSPESSIMKNVDFLYFEETSELIHWCAFVHTKAKLPHLIVIEDILTYATQICDSNLERSLARICATIADAANWIAAKNDVQRCQVLMTAPARITSFSTVLSQFCFKMATYQGPRKDEPNSEVSYTTKDGSINIKFRHHKDSIVISTVQASRSGTH